MADTKATEPARDSDGRKAPGMLFGDDPKAKKNSGGRTREERSAGVIVYRDGGEGRVFLLLDYGKYWDYAKGHVEKGEDDRTAALRELEEETGIREVELEPGFREEIVYFFRHPKRGLVRKTVAFFLGKTRTEQVKLSHEHVGYAWVGEGEALGKVKYPTAKQVFRAARAFLSNR